MQKNNAEMIKEMFEKQNELNIHTNGLNWRIDTNLKWYRAIWTECSELIDYTNWKWWRKQDISLKDIEMELIDIWHFLMSELMTYYDITSCTENSLYKFTTYFETYQNFDMDRLQICTENLAKDTLNTRQALLFNFVKLCSAIGPQMNIPGIYKLYMGKNVLNRFRQDNGYKQKTYQKIWNGKEDNFYLMEYLGRIVEIGDDFEEEVYKELDKQYKKFLIVK